VLPFEDVAAAGDEDNINDLHIFTSELSKYALKVLKEDEDIICYNICNTQVFRAPRKQS